MREPSSQDDAFADFYNRLPKPSQPREGAQDAASGERQAAHDTAPPSPTATGKASSAHGRDGTTIEDLFPTDTGSQAVHKARHDRDRRKSRIAAWSMFAIILLILGGVAAGGAWVWTTYEGPIRSFMGWEEPKDFEEGLAEGDVLVTIVVGDTGSTISDTLFEAGVTKTADAFYSHLISTGQDPTFQPGVYTLHYKMTSAAALEAILDPANRRENSVVVTEGMTMSQAISALAAGTGVSEDELRAEAANYTQFGVPAASPSIEGWLFPATYTFEENVTARDAIQRLVTETFSRLDALGVPEADRQQVLTLAALVQKESGPSIEDMHKIARVFLNRVAEGMPLQSDATVAYGAGITGTVWTTDAERGDESNPYNTYVHLGMPIGPISNPGEHAIEAAMSPAAGDWLYFVAVDLRTGETAFSATYEEHLAAVERLEQWCAQQENESYCA